MKIATITLLSFLFISLGCSGCSLYPQCAGLNGIEQEKCRESARQSAREYDRQQTEILHRNVEN